mmetsp:Transcript_35840/g.71317  ORF Transcript_35840/g.71317 Transcript_35840/m.71317 type:complete len:247 (+) Transcript_35840:38-778(+)
MRNIFIIMAFLLALSRGRAFARSPARITGSVARMLSVQGGSLPATEEGKVMYALGLNIARQVGGELKGVLTPEELTNMVSGFSDSINNKVADDKAILSQYGPKINEVLMERTRGVVDKEKKKGLEFVTKFLHEHPNAINTESGLVYNELVAGMGKQPTIDSTVKVHYHGMLPDGTVFDSSVERGEPISFPLKQVIRGWQEGVPMMKVGGKATLVIPSDIAYGDQGSPPVIAPGATLVFELELLECN